MYSEVLCRQQTLEQILICQGTLSSVSVPVFQVEGGLRAAV